LKYIIYSLKILKNRYPTSFRVCRACCSAHQ